MNREQFIRNLEHSIRKIKHDERQDILHDYEEYFDIGIEEGKTEEEIAASLGSPHQIAKELTAVYYLEKAEAASSASNILRAVWAAISLGFFNFTIVLGPFLALVSLVFSGWVVAISFIAAPFIVLLNLVMYPASFEIFDLFVSAALAGLGMLISIGMVYVSRRVFKGFVKYIRYNTKLVQGGLNRE